MSVQHLCPVDEEEFEATTSSSAYVFAVVGIMLTAVVAFACGYLTRKGIEFWRAPAVRSFACQSQCTYRRDLHTPRFQALSAFQTAAFME